MSIGAEALSPDDFSDERIEMPRPRTSPLLSARREITTAAIRQTMRADVKLPPSNLSELNEDQAAKCARWYRRLEDRNRGIAPREVTTTGKLGYALHTHYRIADHVAHYGLGKRTVIKIIDRDTVDAHIRYYYSKDMFPLNAVHTPAKIAAEREYHREGLAMVKAHTEGSMELQAVSAVLRAMYGHRAMHPEATKAVFDMAAAYGHALIELGEAQPDTLY